MSIVFENDTGVRIYKCVALISKKTWYPLFVPQFNRVANFKSCEAAFAYWEKEFKL